jgi:Rrf2 family protein
MILNQSAHYALRAVLFLAGHAREGARTADEVAEAIGVPRNYLGKLLHELARAEVLTSMRGRRGGFGLAAPAEQIPLEAVIAPFQELPHRGVCLLGDRPCDPTRPCAAHTRWSRMADPVTAFFRETTVALMLHPPAGEGGRESPAAASPGRTSPLTTLAPAAVLAAPAAEAVSP